MVIINSLLYSVLINYRTIFRLFCLSLIFALFIVVFFIFSVFVLLTQHINRKV